jgi:hypothetical protein
MTTGREEIGDWRLQSHGMAWHGIEAIALEAVPDDDDDDDNDRRWWFYSAEGRKVRTDVQ